MSWHLREKKDRELSQLPRRLKPHSRTRLSVEFWTGAPRSIPALEDFGELARSLLLDRYAPPSILVDGNLTCLSFFGSVERYLEPKPWPATPDLLRCLCPEWRQKVEVALARVCEQGDAGDDRVATPDEAASMSVAVLPIRNGSEEFFVISFLDTKPPSDRSGNGSVMNPLPAGPVLVRFDPVGREGADQIDELSPRQRTVLEFLVMGYSNKQIAAELGISRRTVESHRAIVMRRLDVRTFADLIRLAATA